MNQDREEFNCLISNGSLQAAEEILFRIRQKKHDEKYLESMERDLFRAYYGVKDWSGAKRIVLVTKDSTAYLGRKDRLENLSNIKFDEIPSNGQKDNSRGLKLVTKNNIGEIDFKSRLYIVQDKTFFYILTEVDLDNFLFICFTEHDYAIGENDCSFPSGLNGYPSAEDAVSDVLGLFDVYEFSTRQDYILWLISEMRKKLESYSGDWSD